MINYKEKLTTERELNWLLGNIWEKCDKEI